MGKATLEYKEKALLGALEHIREYLVGKNPSRIFKIPTPLMLDKIVTTMDGIYEQMAQLQTADTRGDVYEYLLSKIATAGVNGQFRTPRHISA